MGLDEEAGIDGGAGLPCDLEHAGGLLCRQEADADECAQAGQADPGSGIHKAAVVDLLRQLPEHPGEPGEDTQEDPQGAAHG